MATLQVDATSFTSSLVPTCSLSKNVLNAFRPTEKSPNAAEPWRRFGRRVFRRCSEVPCSRGARDETIYGGGARYPPGEEPVADGSWSLCRLRSIGITRFLRLCSGEGNSGARDASTGTAWRQPGHDDPSRVSFAKPEAALSKNLFVEFMHPADQPRTPQPGLHGRARLLVVPVPTFYRQRGGSL
jgi:hypothetical protein